VRALSANVGSAIAGWLLAAPEPACFPIGCEDISVFTVFDVTLWNSELSFTTEFGGRPVLQLELPSVGHFVNYARVPADQEAIRKHSKTRERPSDGMAFIQEKSGANRPVASPARV
jgi:hypothetical protein